MRKTTKILALLLALLMILPLAVACKKDEEEGPSGSLNDNGVVGETDEYGQQILADPIPEELDFNGSKVSILIRGTGDNNYSREFTRDTQNDALDQAVYSRNKLVEEDLGVKLDYIIVDTPTGYEINTAVEKAGMSGSGEFDLVANYAALAMSSTIMGYYMNYYNSKLTYFNLDQPYWNQQYIKNATVDGKLYSCVGDLNLSVWDRSVGVFFNRTLLESYNVTTIDELYQTVINGDWTYDLFYSYIKDFHYDVNGTIENATDDIYGVSGIWNSEAPDGFLYGFNLDLTETHSNGSITLVTDRTRLTEAWQKMCDFWYSDGAYRAWGVDPGVEMFTKGNSVFHVDILFHKDSSSTLMRDMPDGYGLLPMPKYDENQENYTSGTQDAYNVMSIMYNHGQDYDMVSAVFEDLNYESYRSVRSLYVEKILMRQFMDEQAVECMNMIFDGVYWDKADVYAIFLDAARHLLWRSPAHNYRQGGTLTHAFAEYEDGINENLEWLQSWMESMPE